MLWLAPIAALCLLMANDAEGIACAYPDSTAYGDNCYAWLKYGNHAKAQADMFCTMMYKGTAASIRVYDQWKLFTYVKFPGMDYFMGITKVNGVWKYPDGSSVTYTNWENGKPDPNYDCAMVEKTQGAWRAVDCGTGADKQYILCEYKGTPDPTTTSTTTTTTTTTTVKKPVCPTVKFYEYNKYCYLSTCCYYKQSKYDADVACQYEGATVPYFKDYNTWKYLTFVQFPGRDFYLGITRVNGVWQYPDKTPLTFTFWDYNEPNPNANYNCALQLATGNWKAVECTAPKDSGNLLCQVPGNY